MHARSRTAGLGWRLLAFGAFAGTAALAVTLSSHGPQQPRLTAREHRSHRCAVAATRLHIIAVSGHMALDFTNVSRRSCELRGYPVVTLAGSGITGSATGELASLVQTVLLRPGGTAHADTDLMASGCRLVAVGGLRVGLPGYPPVVYIRHRLIMCAGVPQGGTLLRVGAIEPGAFDSPLRGDTSPGR